MAAAKGNKYAEGLTNSGRPRIYENPEDLHNRIIEYFNYLDENHQFPTITGLSLFLGFCDKSTLYDYAKRQEFSHSIKRALQFVENHYETRLNDSGPTGAIFALKNMGWEDKQKYDVQAEVTTSGDHKVIFERYKPEPK